MPKMPTYLIYVVEDDEDDRFLLQDALTTHRVSCKVCFFTSGSELFIRLTHQLDGRLPDMILLDLDTPLMNGFDTLRLLKQMDEYRRVPVIVRSAFEGDKHINQCYELGCQAYVTKTNHPLQLASTVGAFCSAA